MLNNKLLLEGNDIFKKSYFKKHAKKLLNLAKNGQHPKALFIGCADSRVVPNLITETAPGDLFVLRNVGNFVAPFKPDQDFHATASGIEYAVHALKVSEIIICGHTNCGAIESLYSDIDEYQFVHTKKWLSLGEQAKSLTLLALGKDANKEDILRLTEKFSVLTQLENLLTYPFVKERVENGSIQLQGWMYDISTGEIEFYDPEESTFRSLKKFDEEVQNV
jgi:carbonic anhydrase